MIDTNRRKTIGVLMRNFNDSRAIEVWKGISGLTQAAGVNVICFEAGIVHRKDFESSRLSKVIAQRIQPGTIDGLVTMQYWHSKAWFEEFCQSYLALPIVTITRTYDGYSGVKSNTYFGVRSMIGHLVEMHGYRKFLCLPGRMSNPTHVERHCAYIDALESYGIDPAATFLDPVLLKDDRWEDSITPDQSNLEHGALLVSAAIDRAGLLPGRDFEVVFTTGSDTLLLGAMEELQRRGIRIPYDVAMAGVENIYEDSVSTPALSTIGVDWHGIGATSARILLDQLEGTGSVRHEEVHATMEYRRSCGCFPVDMEYCEGGDALADDQGMAGLQEAFLFDIAIAEIPTGFKPRFLPLFETALVKNLKQGGNLHCAHKVLSELHRTMLPLLTSDSDQFVRADKLWQQSRLLVSHFMEQVQSHKHLAQGQILSRVQNLGQRLVNTFDVHMIMQILSEELPKLGIRRSYLSLYEDPTAPYGQARLVLAYDDNGVLDLPETGITFMAPMLIPQGIVSANDTWSLIVETLYFEENQIGFVLFDTSSHDPTLFDMLRSEISSALKGALLMQRVHERTNQIESTNQALQESLASLRSYQNRMVQSEKMAALGQLVAGIAHEVNTPLGTALTAASLQDHERRKIQESYHSNTLRKTDMDQYFADSDHSSRIVLTSLDRAAELIKSFKRIAVDQSFEELRSFEFKSYLQDVLRSLQPRLRQVKHDIILECPEEMTIKSYPGAYYQIFSNLIINSVVHGFESSPEGSIRIVVSLNAGVLAIVYEDDGAGMDPATAARMFDPFFTTKRGQGGTGLGMNIVYNLVTQRLHGTIDCVSEPGTGTRFEIQIPVRE